MAQKKFQQTSLKWIFWKTFSSSKFKEKLQKVQLQLQILSKSLCTQKIIKFAHFFWITAKKKIGVTKLSSLPQASSLGNKSNDHLPTATTILKFHFEILNTCQVQPLFLGPNGAWWSLQTGLTVRNCQKRSVYILKISTAAERLSKRISSLAASTFFDAKYLLNKYKNAKHMIVNWDF